MLSIGEFSKICQVSAKTLRYYEEIGLLTPGEVNSESGYRYYAVEQLETMLFINRLKSYHFSLEEIKGILLSDEPKEEKLYDTLVRKRNEIQKNLHTFEQTLQQLDGDIINLEQGKSIMAYLDDIDIQLADVLPMYLLSIRKMVKENNFPEEYRLCFGKLLKKMQNGHLTFAAPPMVLFHSKEFTALGMDTEFAIPIKEYVTGTRDFEPGLCLKTVVKGSYSNLPSVYTKQMEWANKEGYECTGALFEMYVTDPSQTASEEELVTEVYYPVKKRA